jgi:hypothetical protein
MFKPHSKDVNPLLVCICTVIVVGLLVLPALAASNQTEEMQQIQPEATEDPTLLDTRFTYQGYLEQDAVPVTAACDLQFGLFNALTAGTQIGTTLTQTAVTVNGGIFNVQLDFGVGVFNGEDRYLQIGARCPSGTGVYTTLSPRQPITSVPYAMALYGLRVETNPFSPNVIGGHTNNNVTADVVGATISGGGSNYSLFTGLPFDNTNRVTDNYGTVSGGLHNTAGNNDATRNNAEYATVGGGWDNTAGGFSSTVIGGYNNRALGWSSLIVGGVNNLANNTYATIVGGFENRASGVHSFVAGELGNATHDGAFVWSSNFYTYSFGPDTFTARAPGGVRFYTANSGTTTGVELPAGGGSWATLSDRASKENFTPVNTRAVLESVASLPLTTWNYIAQDDSTRHMGVTAQDFYAAFGLGESETRITTVDADGVAFAAIQGLYQVVQEKDAKIADLEARLARLEGLASGGQSATLLPVVLLIGGTLAGWVLRRKHG